MCRNKTVRSKPPDKIFASREDLEEYYLTFRNNGKVYRYWRDVVKSMPMVLKEEVRTKPTRLVLQSGRKCGFKGLKAYQFVTVGASEGLRGYLEEFVVFVKNVGIK